MLPICKLMFAVGVQSIAVSFLLAVAWRRISLHRTCNTTMIQNLGSHTICVFAVVHIVYAKCSTNVSCERHLNAIVHLGAVFV
jgi:hypothetical protein